MIPTRDGKRMATDIYRPGRGGTPISERLPVLLNRTPYNKTSLAEQAVFYAERGYVVALQDTRGRYKSEGEFSKVQPADATDGYDVIEWLARQPYSNGAVGMWGTSFAAHTQAGAAQYRPPALKALLINMGGMSNAWDHGVRSCGEVIRDLDGDIQPDCEWRMDVSDEKGATLFRMRFKAECYVPTSEPVD